MNVLPAEVVAPLRLKKITLRGIGSYYDAAEIEIRPITILCGTNGSGKSTWLNALRMVQEAIEAGTFPFDLPDERESEDYGYTNAHVEPSENKGPISVGNDQEHGPAGSIGLHFDVYRDFSLDALASPPVQFLPDSPIIRAIAGGSFKAGDAIKVVITRPKIKRGESILPGGFSLSIGEESIQCVYKERKSDRNVMDADLFITQDRSHRGFKMPGTVPIQGIIITHTPPTEEVKSHAYESEYTGNEYPGCDVSAFIMASRKRIEQFAKKLLDGFFYLGAIRKVQNIKDAKEIEGRPSSETYPPPRHVGKEGQFTHSVHRAFYSLQMINHCPPYSGRIDMNPGAVRMEDEWFFHELIIGTANDNNLRKHLFSLIPEEIASDWDNFILANWAKLQDLDYTMHGGHAIGDDLKNCLINAKAPKKKTYLEKLEERKSELETQGYYPVLNEDEFCLDFPDGRKPESFRSPFSVNERNELSELDKIRKEKFNNIFEHILKSPAVYNQELWPEITNQSYAYNQIRHFLNIGLDKLCPEDIIWFNRLLLKSPLGEDDSHRGFVFFQYCSFWLKSLLNVNLLDRYADDTWNRLKEWERPEEGPLGFLYIPEFRRDFKRNQECQDFLGSTFRNKESGMYASPANFSTGFHQLFPIIVQLGVMQRNEICAIENPEVHLHPGLQLRITEFLLAQAKIGKHIIIETHSDLVILRVIREIIEEKISQKDVKIYFTKEADIKLPEECEENREKIKQSIVELISVKHGQIDNWPEGFIDDGVRESRELMRAMYSRIHEIDNEEGIDE